MADEETQRTMQFILEQQAQLTATVGRLSEKVDRTADGINSLLAIAELHEREIEAMRESVNAVSESVNAVDVRGRETDERLNALIDTVERYISERRNGKS
jgi:ABC-type transporter Mla subunit MlaD